MNPFLPVVTAALADGYVRLERVFGDPNPRQLTVDAPSVGAGVLQTDKITALKVHFIRYVLGPEVQFDAGNREEVEEFFENTREALRYAATEKRDAFFASSPSYRALEREIRDTLKLEHLLLIFPSGAGGAKEVITDPIFLFSHAFEIFQFIKPKLTS